MRLPARLHRTPFCRRVWQPLVFLTWEALGFFLQSVRQVGREGLVFTRGVCVCRPPTCFLRTVPLTLSFSPSDPADPAFLFFPCFMLLGSSGRPTPPLAPAVHLLQSFFLL